MSLSQVVLIFGHAYAVGQQHFDLKTFTAMTPFVIYATALYVVLERKYRSAPRLGYITSIILSN